MNAYLRTLPLPRAVRPVRELGSSALDRVVTTWAAPNPAARVLDQWGAPTFRGRTVVAPWPAPDPIMRFDLPAPRRRRPFVSIDGPVPRADLVDPRHAVRVPDLLAASRVATASPFTGPVPAGSTVSPEWAAPNANDEATPGAGRRGVRRRVLVGLVAVAGAAAVGGAALITLL